MQKIVGPFEAKEPLYGKISISFEDNKKLFADFPDNTAIRNVYVPLFKTKLEKEFTKVGWILTNTDISNISTEKIDTNYFNLKGFTLEVKIKPGENAMTLAGTSGEGGGGGGSGGFATRQGDSIQTAGPLLLITIITLAISATVVTLAFTIDGEEWFSLGESISSIGNTIVVVILAFVLLKIISKE